MQKLGPNLCANILQEAIVNHHESNENGKKCIMFAIEKEMKIMSTYFQHKDIHKGT